MELRKCTICLGEVCNTTSTTTGESLSSQLSAIYLVRKILGVSLDECTQFLQRYGNPEKWVTLCTSCSSILHDAKETSRKILDLKDELECLKQKLMLPMQVKDEDSEEFAKSDLNEASYRIRKCVHHSTRFLYDDNVMGYTERDSLKNNFDKAEDEYDQNDAGVSLDFRSVSLSGNDLEKSLIEGNVWKCPTCEKSYTVRRTWRDHIRRKHRPFLQHLDEKVTEDHICRAGICFPKLSAKLEINASSKLLSVSTQIDTESQENIFEDYPENDSDENIKPTSPSASFADVIENKSDQSPEQEVVEWNCSVCDKTYKTNKSLREHIRNKHSSFLQSLDQIKTEQKPDINIEDEVVEAEQRFAIKRPIRLASLELRKKYSSSSNTLKSSSSDVDKDSDFEVDFEKSKSDHESDDEYTLPKKIRKKVTKQSKFVNADKKLQFIDKRKRYECKFCETRFDRVSRLNIHLQYNHNVANSDLFKKDDNKIVAPPKEKLRSIKKRIRIEGIDKRKRYECKFCETRFDRVSRLNIHLQYKHNVANSDLFSKDDDKIVTPPKDWNQLIKEREEKLKLLPTTEACVDEETRKKRRKERVNLSLYALSYKYKITEFPCQECTEIFKTFKEWDNHRNKEHLTGFRCNLCDKVVQNQMGLENHMRSQHHPKANLACPGCSKIIKKLDEFNLHLKRNPECKAKALPCTTCKNVLLASQKCLDLHHKIRHVLPLPSPFVCEICNKGFNFKITLKAHQQMYHSETPSSIVCEHCGKTFPHILALRSHKDWAHKNRKIPCSICKKEFRSSAAVQRHKKTHSEDAPYMCPICGKRFKICNYLTIHLWSHDPDRKNKYSSYKPKKKPATINRSKKRTNIIPHETDSSSNSNLYQNESNNVQNPTSSIIHIQNASSEISIEVESTEPEIQTLHFPHYSDSGFYN